MVFAYTSTTCDRADHPNVQSNCSGGDVDAQSDRGDDDAQSDCAQYDCVQNNWVILTEWINRTNRPMVDYLVALCVEPVDTIVFQNPKEIETVQWELVPKAFQLLHRNPQRMSVLKQAIQVVQECSFKSLQT